MSKADIGWTKADIITLIDESDRAVERAILAIHARQTADEKSSGNTKHVNARGFNQADANYGSYCARWILRGNHLTGKHLGKCRTLVRKYHKQLREEANTKLAKAIVEAFTVLAERAPKTDAPITALIWNDSES
jgi:hypothetical protein